MNKIPKIYYFNREKRTDLKSYMESNFHKIGIVNYERISIDYDLENYQYWKDLLLHEEKVNSNIIDELSLSITIIQTLKKWVETSNDETIILTEDVVDFSFFEYFHFEVDYFFKNLPYDWDSILLGFEDLLGVVPCFLHPVSDSHGTGVTLLNRKYVKKLIKLHYKNEKFNFFHKISNNFWKTESGFVPPHYFLNQCGRSYAIPLFPRNPDITEDKYFDLENLRMNKKLYFLFWKKLKENFSVEDFFCYFSSKDLYLNPKKKTVSLEYSNINKLSV